MITKLTQQQKDKIPLYVKEWIDIGLSTADEIDKEAAKKAIALAYKKAGLPAPKLYIFTESPMHNGILYGMLKEVRGSIGGSIGDSIRASIANSVRASIGDSIGASIRGSIAGSIGASIAVSIANSIMDSIGESIGGSCCGTHDAHWLAYYKFLNDECNIDLSILEGLLECAKHCGWFIPYKDICLVSPKPKQINTIINSGRHILHGDGKPAIYYCEDFQIWALNGIRVPRYLAETPAGLLDIEFFKKEKNADVKAEFIRKYGIDRMVNMGKVVDTYANYNNEWWAKSEYKLVDMASIFTSIKYAPHLYMRNQTTGVYHLEAVTPDCKNIPEAISKVRWKGRDITQFTTVDIK